jgi:hypothetical protein
MNFKHLFFTITLFLSSQLYAQERYEKEIETLSQQLHTQVVSPGVKYRLATDSNFYKVALVGIENEDGKSTKLTDLLEKELAINLAIASNGKYNVLDRIYIDKLLKEKNIPKDLAIKKISLKIWEGLKQLI